jgi:hypothetical protein
MIGILKAEFGLNQKFWVSMPMAKDYQHACKIIPQVIHNYNTIRPHLSCCYLTPEEANNQARGLENKWRLKSYQHINKRKKVAKKKATITVKLI